MKRSNVQIVSGDISTFRLIDSAQAVATPGGTVGWESLVRGVPVLNFGCVWYAGCQRV